jgi:hypothetical protein
LGSQFKRLVATHSERKEAGGERWNFELELFRDLELDWASRAVFKPQTDLTAWPLISAACSGGNN